MKSPRVLIADAVPAYVLGLQLGLRRAGFDLVGEVCAADDVAAMYEALQASVLVLDMHLGTSGADIGRHAAPSFGLATQLLRHVPAARVVFHGENYTNDELIHEAYQLGAAAFVTKQAELAIMVDMLRQVCEHDSARPCFMPEIANRLALRAMGRNTSPKSVLAGRDLEVFRLMAHGWTNLEIADEMDLSVKTISTTSQRIKDTLGVHRPAHFTRLAVRHGIISVQEAPPRPRRRAASGPSGG